MRTPSPFAILALGLSATILVIAGSGYMWWHVMHGPVTTLDPTIKIMLAEAGRRRVYAAHIETTATLSERSIHIEGTYLVNAPENRFASHATTTLVIANAKNETHSFSLQNISIDDVVYTKLSTESPIFKKTILVTDGWKSFKKDSIPEEFKNIAATGPVLDNLLLLSNDGEYLSFVHERGEEIIGGKHLKGYTFKLSGKAMEKNIGGTLETLFNRLGFNGFVDLWFDMQEKRLVLMHFENTDYTSTTSISTAIPFEINAPL